jgi:hypothetical protein
MNKNPIDQEKQSQYQNRNSENRCHYGARVRQPSSESIAHDLITSFIVKELSGSIRELHYTGAEQDDNPQRNYHDGDDYEPNCVHQPVYEQF